MPLAQGLLSFVSFVLRGLSPRALLQHTSRLGP